MLLEMFLESKFLGVALLSQMLNIYIFFLDVVQFPFI